MRPTSAEAARAIRILARHYPERGGTDLGNAADTLLATVLSARTTDVQVLKIYPAFRRKFPTWEALADADVGDIAASIKTIGLYPAKAKALKGLAQKIRTEFHGRVPHTMEELVTLPGVGRKTASVVLACSFQTPAIAVDTHVFRVAHRLGWSRGKTPVQVERDLCALIPHRAWIDVNRSMVQFGRDMCKAGTPQCWRCPIAHLCAFRPKTPPPTK